MLTIRHERMSPVFEKWHIDGLPFAAALHRFTGPDEGDPHDHPFDFTSHVLGGGFIEQVFTEGGNLLVVGRVPGDSYESPATRVHRIVGVPNGECWTLVRSGPYIRTPRFWRFGPDGPKSRAWNEEWV